jgi:serine/threonine protein kinase/dipeptidyl aminopeptidase/acylaminoacyl peptidase
MTLSSGSKLGRYEIRSQLGAGGMGEVYQARDPKINRDVAIKVLPAAVSSDSERLRRFEQEVQATGKLNHPNILAVYDVETHDGAPYVVYELLEGETLRERLRGGALSARKAVEFAVQIANGLSAAHGKGIVHRDLKPDNIFITNDGHLKILDFGLAKLVEPNPNVEHQTDVLTRKATTDPGAVMGTAGYMSPEQVRGRPVDHRTDIFSFGAVLYEMLSGRRAFHGESAIETLNAILKEDPPDLTTNPNVAQALERVVSHCLEKNPERRFQSATDVAFALESLSGITSFPSQHAVTTVSARSPSRLFTRERLIWAAICTLLLVVAAALAFSNLSRAKPNIHPVQLALSMPEKITRVANVTVSPDGFRVAFVSWEGKREIWIRPLDGTSAQPLAGTDGAISPFWSPDSRFLGYFAKGKLYKVDASGGRPQVLCDVREDRGGAWNRDGVILFAGPDGLYRVSAQGGAPTLATKTDTMEEAHRWPYFLPDGKHFVFLGDAASSENHHIRLGSLDSQDSQILFGGITRIAYAPPGYLIYVSQGALVAQPFDSQKLRLSGEATTLAESVATVGDNHEFDFSVSENGVLAYQSSSRKAQLVWIDRSGKNLGVVGDPDAYAAIALSPDGKRALTSLFDADGRMSDIWLFDLSRPNKSRLTFDPQSDGEAVWSPDGQRIVFTSNRGGNGHSNLYITSANASGNDQKLLVADADDIPTDWSHDGQYILIMRWTKDHAGIWLFRPTIDSEAKPLLWSAAFDQGTGVFSPNDRFIAYTTNESGRFEVFVQSFPPSDNKWPVSSGGGVLPLWRHDGRELFYLTLDGKVMSVDVKTDGPFESGTPKELFQTDIQQGPGLPYAVTPDGSRFLVKAAADTHNSNPLMVVLNWTAKLKQNQ